MASGFCPYLLQHIAEITKDATPQYKVQPNGLTNMLMTAGNPAAIKVGSYDGHKKTVIVKSKQRFTKQQTDTSASCTQTLVPSYNEDTVTVDSFRQIAFHIDDETIAQYCSDASAMVTTGAPPTQVMAEIYDTILTSANAILQGVNDDLWGLVNFGFNVVEGDANATTINISKDSTDMPIDDGFPKLIGDYARSFLTGRPQVVGSGLILNFFLSQFAKSFDAGGVNTKIFAGAVDFFHDDATESVLGANHFGIFEPNSVQLVEYLRYTGFKAGVKPDGSVFGIIPLPLQVAGGVMPVKFDFQLKYNSCPETFTDAYTSQSLSLDKGYNLILSKQFGLWQIKSNAYRAEDDASGVTGALHYIATNS